ncbi:hypothetical protein [Saccharibacillus sacchari]|uniref:Uncharacterized protein n=1 Tax=Saccharibacillus sacchari TaxID=456493 RepID=A0ACC6P9K3_9BACL
MFDSNLDGEGYDLKIDGLEGYSGNQNITFYVKTQMGVIKEIEVFDHMYTAQNKGEVDSLLKSFIDISIYELHEEEFKAKIFRKKELSDLTNDLIDSILKAFYNRYFT